MNSDEHWLRTAPSTMEEGNFGNCSKSRVDMVLDGHKATKSAKDGSKSRGKEPVDGIMPINSELSKSSTCYSQLGLNGQDYGEFAGGTTILKKN